MIRRLIIEVHPNGLVFTVQQPDSPEQSQVCRMEDRNHVLKMVKHLANHPIEGVVPKEEDLTL